MGLPIFKGLCLTKGSVESVAMQRENLDLTGAVLDFQVRDIINEILLFSGDSNDVSPNSRIIINDLVTADITLFFSEVDTNKFDPEQIYKTDIRVTPAGGGPFYYIGLEFNIVEPQTK